jgi:hypothetical protein
MALRDLQSSVNTTLLFTPQTVSADTLTRDLDMRGYQFATISALIGARGDTWDTNNHIQLEVEESDDNRTWSDCANAVLQTIVTGSNTGTFAKLATAGAGTCVKETTYRGSKNFIRVVVNLTGTHSTGTIIGIMVQRYGSHKLAVPRGGTSASASTSPSTSVSPSVSSSPSRSPSTSLSPSTSRSPSASTSPSSSASPSS